MDPQTQLLQLLFAGVSTGSIYGIIAVGFNVIFKSTGAINFTQGEWVMIGGMLSAFFFVSFDSPIWVACAAAVLCIGVLGVLSERFVIEPLRNPSPVTLTLVTIGLAIVTKSGVMLTLGKNPAGYPGFSGETPIMIAGASLHPQTVWIIVVAALFMLAVHFFFERTLTGKAMRAAAADREVAVLMGVRVRHATMMAFAIAALAGGVAGAIITPLTFTSYDHGTVLGFKGFSAAMLGGVGNLYGAMVGGLLLGILESLAGGYISSQFKDAVAFMVLLGILFFRPTGLFGHKEIEKV
ncbi:MAG: branched-chain amino acid ABC transporter permease [Alphaproteobacteria bacterium]|nr:branched-chain amino acid ABC transporter permease [Alphaproteobacteria bacterium]